MKKINLSHFEPHSRANGPGVRAVIWVQGCSIGCKDCINQHTWPHKPKELVTVDELFNRVMGVADLIEGVTFSGGEPFQQAGPLAKLTNRLSQAGLSIVCFTGFTLEFLKSQKAPTGSELFLQQIDLLIDGPYIEAKKTNSLPLRGSANQRLCFLTNQYSIVDVNCPRVEFHISQGQITSTGFMGKEAETALFATMGVKLESECV
ncbi:4Fe-4S single cluster domain-containing protein [Patescibacteria group bacterium]